MQVKNVSARAVLHRGRVYVPGEVAEVSDDHANDFRGVASLELVEVVKETKPAKAARGE